VRWYALMYWSVSVVRLRWAVRARKAWRGYQRAEVDDLLFWGGSAVTVGGRLGTCCCTSGANICSHRWRSSMLGMAGIASHGGHHRVIIVMCCSRARVAKALRHRGGFVVPLIRSQCCSRS